MAAPKLDVSFIKMMALSTIETLKIQCSIDAKVGKPHEKKPDEKNDIVIAGIIGISATGLTGSVAIAFPEKAYLKVMSGMLGQEYTSMTQELEDGAGELLNIIFGVAKKTLNDAGHDINRAVPSVVRGTNIRLFQMSPKPAMVIPFSIGADMFFIEIVID